jgi:UDP-glucose 4-epimerase
LRILVTGGAGFIGSHVVDAFLSAGHEVAVIDDLWVHGGGRREHVNPRAAFYDRDIRDPDIGEIFTQLFRPDVVCHHAAQHSVSLSNQDPQHDADVNVRGLLNILQASVKAQARKFIFASSSATYGTPQYLPIDERHPQIPESPYGISKMVGEHYLRYFGEAFGLKYTAFRYGNVYGPRQDPNGEAGVIAIFATRMLRGESIRIDWDGEQQKDYVYVSDVARANVAALEKADDEIMNIGTGSGTSVNALHRAIAQEVGRDVEVVPAPKRAGDVRACVFDTSKAKTLLGWEPSVALGEGIKLTVESARAVFEAGGLAAGKQS